MCPAKSRVELTLEQESKFQEWPKCKLGSGSGK